MVLQSICSIIKHFINAMTLDDGNYGAVMEHAQHVAGLNQLMECLTPLVQIFIHQIKKTYTIIKRKENISALEGSVNAHS